MITAFMAALAVCASLDTPYFEEDLVFPPEPLHNHSSSIVETPAGDLLVSWFHGRGEKTDDTLVILGARKSRDAADWSAPFEMADNPNLPDQNPMMYIDAMDKLWLFWISSLDNTRRGYMLKYKTSTDYDGDGAPRWDWQDVIVVRPTNLFERFSANAPVLMEEFPEKYDPNNEQGFDKDDNPFARNQLALELGQDKLFQRLGWMTRTQPIMLDGTRMMLPLYSDIYQCSLAGFTDDGGKTWTYSEPILDENVQPVFVPRKNGDIVAFMRDKRVRGRMPMSISRDGGLTWTRVESTEIPNPDSSVDCRVLESGNWLLVCNDNAGGNRRNGRNELTAYLSEDEGVSWKWRKEIEKHDETVAASYPCLIQARDGSIHLTYTYSPEPNETIKHVRFNESWVKAAR